MSKVIFGFLTQKKKVILGLSLSITVMGVGGFGHRFSLSLFLFVIRGKRTRVVEPKKLRGVGGTFHVLAPTLQWFVGLLWVLSAREFTKERVVEWKIKIFSTVVANRREKG